MLSPRMTDDENNSSSLLYLILMLPIFSFPAARNKIRLNPPPRTRRVSMGGTRIFEVGAARGQVGGHGRQTKIIVIGFSTEN